MAHRAAITKFSLMSESHERGEAARTAGPDAEFARQLAAGEFRIQQCGSCRAHIFYPRPVCTRCGSTLLAWVTPSGLGVVHAVSVVNRSKDKGGAYNVVLVDLAEGPRMMSRVEGLPDDAVRIGMHVRARVGEGEEGMPCIVFDPVDERGDP